MRSIRGVLSSCLLQETRRPGWMRLFLCLLLLASPGFRDENGAWLDAFLDTNPNFMHHFSRGSPTIDLHQVWFPQDGECNESGLTETDNFCVFFLVVNCCFFLCFQNMYLFGWVVIFFVCQSLLQWTIFHFSRFFTSFFHVFSMENGVYTENNNEESPEKKHPPVVFFFDSRSKQRWNDRFLVWDPEYR